MDETGGDPRATGDEQSGTDNEGTAPLEILANESDAAMRRVEREGEQQSHTVKILHLQYEVKKLEAKIRRMQKDMKKKDEKILELVEELGWADEDQLKDVKTMKQRKKESKKKEEEEMLKQQSQNIPEETVWRFFFKFAGFSRFSMLSDEWHEINPTAANQLFGFRTWKEAKDVVHEKFPWMDMKPPQIFQVYNDKGQLDLELRECNSFEQCFAVKMMDRTGLTAKRMALLYGRDKRAITKWKQKWIPKWGLPGYNAGGEEDDGDTNKRKAGTARPFQSRQMINPVKRKKLPSDKNNNSDTNEPPGQQPKQPARQPAPAAKEPEPEEVEPEVEPNQDDDEDDNSDDDDELDADQADQADEDDDEDDELAEMDQFEETPAPPRQHVPVAAATRPQPHRETNHHALMDQQIDLGSPPFNFHSPPLAAAAHANNLHNQNLHTQNQLGQNMHTQNLQVGLQTQNLQGHNLQDYQTLATTPNIQDLAVAQNLQVQNLQDLQNLQAQGLQGYNVQDFAAAQNLQGVAGAASNLQQNLQPNLQDLYDYLLPAAKRPRYHGYF